MSESKAILQEWLHKANNDYINAQLLLSQNNVASYDLVCFLSQQCIEKLMKAILIREAMPVTKIHDLLKLSEQIRPFMPQFPPTKEALRFLTDCVVDFRYPGDEADLEEAQLAFRLCTEMRQSLLAGLSEEKLS